MTNEEDKKLIEELGLSKLPEDRQLYYLSAYYETLSIRTSIALEEELSDEQLDEFEKLHEKAASDETIQEWLKNAIPKYDEIVAAEEKSLKHDLSQATNR